MDVNRTILYPKLVICFIAAFCLLLIGCARIPRQEVYQTFLEAQEAFEQADTLPVAEQKDAFQRVAAMYQGLIDQGIRSGPIYYNMGNAWARSEEPGRAIAAYHLAQRYMPLDPYVASNLQSMLGGADPNEGGAPVIEYLFFWQDWIGYPSKARIALAVAVLTFLLGLSYIFLPHRRLRRLAVIFLVFTIIASASVAYDWYRFDKTEYAVVAADQATPRKGNSQQYEAVFTTPLSIGTTAVVTARRGDWIQLRFSSGQDGWLPQTDVVVF